jgi:hypothetical protein
VHRTRLECAHGSAFTHQLIDQGAHSDSAVDCASYTRPASASQAREPDRHASCFAAALPGPARLCIPAPLTDQPILSCIGVQHMRLTHDRSFDRFDEILYLVEKTSNVTLPDAVRPLLLPCSNAP